MAAEEAEEALGLFTGIGLSEAKARETLRNGALSALLRRAVLQVRPPRAPTPVSRFLGPRCGGVTPGSPHLPRPRRAPSALGTTPSPRPRPPPPPRPAPGPPVRRGSAPARP